MSQEIKLNQLNAILSDFEYPVSQEEAIVETDDITLILADGTENLGDIIRKSSDDKFESADDLENEVMNLLPRHSVGEPYQSEGEG